MTTHIEFHIVLSYVLQSEIIATENVESDILNMQHHLSKSSREPDILVNSSHIMQTRMPNA